MRPRTAVSPELTLLADRQAGVVTTEQATGLGQTRHSLARLVGDGSWRRLASGLYLTVPTAADFPALAWGGVLLGGDRARLGPRTSAHLHGLAKPPPETVDVLVSADLKVRVVGPWQFIRDSSVGRSSRVIGQPPRLVVDDTVIDLAARSGEADVVGLVTQAVSSHKTTAPRLLRTLERRGRHPHRALLRAMLADVAEGAESPIELMYLRDVERPHGLPKGRRQKSRLGLHYCSDVGYDEHQLLVELDGRDAHEGTGRFRDMRRDNWAHLASSVAASSQPSALAGSGSRQTRPRSETAPDHAWLDFPHEPDLFTHCRRCLKTPLSELIRG